jgi:hypothetical protein
MRIEAIEPDIKKDWYQVTLLFLTIPAQTVTWILREAYIHGELFTMGGQPVRLERVEKQKTEDRKQDTLEKLQTTEKPQPAVQNVKVLPFKKEIEYRRIQNPGVRRTRNNPQPARTTEN